MSDDRLTLIAGDAGDLSVVSALMQDAIIRAGDIGWDKQGRRLVLLASRYRWEAADTSRVRSALRLETVLAVQRQHWPIDPDAILSLLAVKVDVDQISIAFAGGAGIRCTVETIDAVMEDMSPFWAVQYQPAHD